MSAVHFWNGKEVISFLREITVDDCEASMYEDCYCVDAFFDTDIGRYGRFSSLHDNLAWNSVPFSEFPPLFKTHLLILNIT